MTPTPTTAPDAADPGPVQRWRNAAAHLPALDGPALTAEALVLLLHYGIDWTEGWVTRHRERYWSDILADRIYTATFQSGNLRRFWQLVSEELGSSPRNAEERLDLVYALDGGDDSEVLQILREQTAGLILRVRIIADTVRATRPSATERPPWQ